MSLSNYAAQALLNSFLSKTSNFGALASAPTIYVALFTVKPGEDGTGGTEVSGGSYAREATAALDWNAASSADPSVADNANAIDFGTATADWGTVVAAGFYDAATAGNMLAAFNLSTNKVVSNGDSFQFSAGDLDISFD